MPLLAMAVLLLLLRHLLCAEQALLAECRCVAHVAFVALAPRSHAMLWSLSTS